MKNRNFIYFLGIIVLSVSFSSCATLIGGSQYYAKVQVPNHPNATIEYKGMYQGTGEATFKASRRNANKFSVTIKEDGCDAQTNNFTQRTFRGWAFVGTLLGWTGITNGGIPLPWGVVLDAVTGAWWKPDINEKGVIKQDYKHYVYQINYCGCDGKTTTAIEQKSNSDSISDKIRDLKKLLDEGLITQEEFEKGKKLLLEK